VQADFQAWAWMHIESPEYHQYRPILFRLSSLFALSNYNSQASNIGAKFERARGVYGSRVTNQATNWSPGVGGWMLEGGG
jgi:hypothetical protein